MTETSCTAIFAATSIRGAMAQNPIIIATPRGILSVWDEGVADIGNLLMGPVSGTCEARPARNRPFASLFHA
ncbi:MAG: hypothetical protein Kow0013_13790 [Pararhodobacter sp.]